MKEKEIVRLQTKIEKIEAASDKLRAQLDKPKKAVAKKAASTEKKTAEKKVTEKKAATKK